VRDFLNPERDELYYLAGDPAESTNLIASDGSEIEDARETLHDNIIRRMRAIEDLLLSRLGY
jgi:hypothetical protein